MGHVAFAGRRKIKILLEGTLGARMTMRVLHRHVDMGGDGRAMCE